MVDIEIQKTDIEKGYVWYGLRVSFWMMVLCWIAAIIEFINPENVSFALLWVALIVHTFVTSIIHLVKYDKKGLAVTALVMSSSLLLLVFVGFTIGIMGL